MCVFFPFPPVSRLVFNVLFLSGVQSGWPLWIEGRADSAENVDWWLIVQLGSARPNWLGFDPVLAPCPLGFVSWRSFSFFIFLYLILLPLSISHHKQICSFFPFFCCSKLIAIILCLLFSFFLPWPTLFVRDPPGQIWSHESFHQTSFYSPYSWLFCHKHFPPN